MGGRDEPTRADQRGAGCQGLARQEERGEATRAPLPGKYTLSILVHYSILSYCRDRITRFPPTIFTIE